MTYRGFNIEGTGQCWWIYKRGKKVFTAYWQAPFDSLESAKKTIDESYKMKEQQVNAGKHESQLLHEAWYKKAVLFKEVEDGK